MSAIKPAESKFVDTCIWIDFFLFGKYTEFIGSNAALYVSVLSMYELYKILRKNQVPLILCMHYVNALQSRAIVVPVLTYDAFLAMQYSRHIDLGIADLFIYSSSQSLRTQLVTRDNDFRDLPNVMLLE